jgi:hypothetical protein
MRVPIPLRSFKYQLKCSLGILGKVLLLRYNCTESNNFRNEKDVRKYLFSFLLPMPHILQLRTQKDQLTAIKYKCFQCSLEPKRPKRGVRVYLRINKHLNIFYLYHKPFSIWDLALREKKWLWMFQLLKNKVCSDTQEVEIRRDCGWSPVHAIS